MSGGGRDALFQRFLPDQQQRAFVWKYAQSIGGRRPRHFHGEPELNLVVRGSALVGVGDRIVSVSQGELLAFPSGQDHVLIAGSPDLFLYAIGVDAAYSAEVLGARRGPVMPLHVRLNAIELSAAIKHSAAIVDCPGTAPLGAELWARMQWLGERSTSASPTPASHVLTRRTLQCLGTAPELGLEALSRQVGAHPSEVSRYFHRDIGLTLVAYRTRLRLLRFIQLVEGGGRTFLTAAIDAGFGSYSQCHRAFQQAFDCAPRVFFGTGVSEEMKGRFAPL
jgi:AraC-like DNA-binding protein